MEGLKCHTRWVVTRNQAVWVAPEGDGDWLEATVLELGTTVALVRLADALHSEWVPLTRVVDSPPGP